MKKRLISFLLAVSMMLSILPVGAFAADSANANGIEMDQIMSLGHAEDNAKWGYPIGSGENHDQNVTGNGWHYVGAEETLYLDSGSFVNSNPLNYYTTCKVNIAKGVTVDNWHLWYGDVVNSGTLTNCLIDPEIFTNESDGIASYCRIGKRAYDYTVKNDGKIEYSDFIGYIDVKANPNHHVEGSTANTVTLTGHGSIDYCCFKCNTAYPSSNTITNSAFLNNRQDFTSMYTIKPSDSESDSKLYAVSLDCDSGYGISGLETIGFVGSPTLYIAGETSYGGSWRFAAVNGKAIGASGIPGVVKAETIQPPVSFATMYGFALTPDGTQNIVLSHKDPRKDFTADMFTATVDGQPLTADFTAGTQHEIMVTPNDSTAGFHVTQFIYYTYNKTTGEYEYNEPHVVDVSDKSTWPVNAGKYKIAIAVNDNSYNYIPTDELTDDSWVFEIKASTPSAPHTPVAEDFEYKTLNIMIDNVESLAKSLRESITAKDGIINMDDVTILYYTKDGVKLDAVPTEAGEYHFKLEVKAAADGSYTATDPEQPLTHYNWRFWIRTPSHSVSVTGGQFYILRDDGTKQYPSSELGIPVGTKVYLELDKTYADDPDFEFKGWQLAEDSTKLDGNYNLTLKDGSYFTMPNGNVKLTLITDSVTPGDDDPDTTISSGGDAGAGVAIVLGGAALTGAAYLAGTQVYLETTLGSVPTNRQQMALALWNKAGKPEPVSTELFTDISAAAADSQKAARWCVEQGLMKAEGTTFNPDKYVFRPQVIKAWNDMQAKLKAD